jgi:hypothetical protein
MKQFAYVGDGRVAEVIPEFVTFGEGDQAVDVPLSERYTAEFVASLIECPDGTQLGYTYVDGVFAAPLPYTPPAPTAAEVLAQRDALKAYATSMIDPLNDAVELDDATPAEIAALKAWKVYRLALTRIEQQTGFPGAVNWPVAPS